MAQQKYPLARPAKGGFFDKKRPVWPQKLQNRAGQLPASGPAPPQLPPGRWLKLRAMPLHKGDV